MRKSAAPKITPADPNADPRGYVERMWQRVMSKEESFSAETVARKILASIEQDRHFLVAFDKATRYGSVMEIGRGVIRRTRVTRVELQEPEQPEPSLAMKLAKKTATRFEARFRTWRENAEGRDIELMGATKEELISAAKAREAQGYTQIGRAVFLRRIANQLAPEQKVADKFSVTQLQALYEKVKQENERYGNI